MHDTADVRLILHRRNREIVNNENYKCEFQSSK
jgi:hypothetical protein